MTTRRALPIWRAFHVLVLALAVLLPRAATPRTGSHTTAIVSHVTSGTVLGRGQVAAPRIELGRPDPGGPDDDPLALAAGSASAALVVLAPRGERLAVPTSLRTLTSRDDVTSRARGPPPCRRARVVAG